MPEVASFTTYRTQAYLGPQPTVEAMGSDRTIEGEATAFDVGRKIPYLMCDGEQIVTKIHNDDNVIVVSKKRNANKKHFFWLKIYLKHSLKKFKDTYFCF